MSQTDGPIRLIFCQILGDTVTVIVIISVSVYASVALTFTLGGSKLKLNTCFILLLRRAFKNSWVKSHSA